MERGSCKNCCWFEVDAGVTPSDDASGLCVEAGRKRFRLQPYGDSGCHRFLAVREASGRQLCLSESAASHRPGATFWGERDHPEPSTESQPGFHL